MIERKVYITVKLDVDKAGDANTAFTAALDSFFESLDSAEEAGDIKTYSIVDIEEK